MSPSHSVLVDKKVYASEPSFVSQFIPRIHKQAHLADDACVQCQIDFFTVHNMGTIHGCLNLSAGNFVPMALAECVPERLPLVAYFYEFGFINDDIVDNQTDSAANSKEVEFVVNCIDPNGDTLRVRSSTTRDAVVSKMAAKFLETDPVQGKAIIESWKAFAKTLDKTHDRTFQNIDEYIAFRNVENGWELTLNVARFAYDLAFTEAELEAIDPIQAPILSAATLTNDYFSWEKEYQLHCKSDKSTPLLNAVNLIQGWHSISEEKSKAKLKELIMKLEREYCSLKTEFLVQNPGPSPKILRWFDCLETITAANLLWSISCSRYNLGVENPYPIYHKMRCQQGVSCFPDSTQHQEIVHGISPKTELARFFNGGPEENNQEEANGRPNGHRKAITSGGQLTPEDSSAGSSSTSGSPIRSKSLRMRHSMMPMDETPVLQAATYVQSLPSKAVRKTMISALNAWYNVSSQCLPHIQSIVESLHTASLMLDDVQDNSPKRRGLPTAHSIFGEAQAINAAKFLFVKALGQAQSLSTEAVSIFTDELANLHVGQGYDLLWTYHATVPSYEEYLQMVDRKTGGLFRLASRLMQLHSTAYRDLDMNEFMTLLGRYFQIRDDYQNLNSVQYFQNKGFCEDLDEGKLSFPLIHALSCDNGILRAILESRKRRGFMSDAEKELVLQHLKTAGSLTHTLKAMKSMFKSLWAILFELEGQIQTPNWLLRIVLYKLAV